MGGAALAVAVVLVAIGVSGSGNPTVPGRTIADAAAATSSVSGYRLAVTGSMKMPQLGRSIPITGSGTIDPRGHRGKLRMDMSGLSSLAPGKLSASDLHVDEVLDNVVIYMRSPLFQKQLPGGKQWMKMDMSKVGRSFGLDFSQLGGTDPTQSLDQLRSVSGKVEKLGSATVRGVRTTHYRTRVDLNRYPDLVRPAQRTAAKAGVKRLIAMIGTSSYPAEIWIDARKRVRRVGMSMSFKLPNAPGDQRMSFKMVEDLYDFGIKVKVETPPTDQVFDASKLAGQASLGARKAP
jgi:hypothetical protein